MSKKTGDGDRALKELYTATRKVKEVTAAGATFLAADGEGPPGGDRFQALVPQLYAMAYTIKYALKFAGREDFKVGRLECLHLIDDPARTPKESWRWRLLIRISPAATTGDLRKAAKTLRARKGLDTSGVKRLAWTEGRAAQTLHVGPYDQVGEAYARLESFARENGLAAGRPGHEIYLSDPRRVAAERLKTIVRLPLRKA
jgi:hypothetical protein